MQGKSLAMGNPFRALWGAYERQLQRRPVITQMTTSALLWGAGDLMAQRLERYEQEHNLRTPTTAAAAAPAKHAAPSTDPSSPATDWRRALLTAVYGAVFVGPVGHFWYHGIDKAVARVFAPGTPQFIALKVAIDTAVMGPFYVSTFFGFGCAFIDGGGYSEFARKMRADFVPTLLLEVSLWPFIQSVNFWKVPVQHQLLVVNSATVIDAAFMSWARNQDVSFWGDAHDWGKDMIGGKGAGPVGRGLAPQAGRGRGRGPGWLGAVRRVRLSKAAAGAACVLAPFQTPRSLRPARRTGWRG